MTKEINIGKWLEGENTVLNYLVNLEADNFSNKAKCIFHYPNGEKKMVNIEYQPFLWCKDIKSLDLFNGNISLRNEYAKKFGIAIEEIKIDSNGKEYSSYNYNIDKLITNDEPRLLLGYKYLIRSTVSFQAIKDFLKKGGVNMKHHNVNDLFFYLKPEEQFLIQKKARFFKGYENYSDIHKCYFDIETTGLNPKKEKIFFIGLLDNRGYQKILVNEDVENDVCEANLICEFYEELCKLKPAIIAGYNSEMFDWKFIYTKLEKYNLLGRINTTLAKSYGHNPVTFTTIPSTIKLGGRTEKFDRNIMWGTTLLDVMFSVRRSKALNSDIKEHGLKYITKFFKLNKKDRMYHKKQYGTIYQYYKENKYFIINRLDNDYVPLPEKYQNNPQEYLPYLEKIIKEKKRKLDLCIDNYKYIRRHNKKHPNSFIKLNNTVEKSKFELITGSEIINQYLLDDLYETHKVDEAVNQENFMVTKLLPVSFSKKSTMGSAGMWNLLMSAWSYDNKLAIPIKTKKVDFTGGLSKVLKIGLIFGIRKKDYAGLYPSIKLGHNAFPRCDITGAIKMFLQYFVNTRNIYKTKKQEAEDAGDDEMKKFWDLKQLPLKIFNNSNFGAEGSEYFNWAEMEVSETVTCFGRQYIRKLVHYYMQFGFVPLVLDTDGCNFSIPKYTNVDLDLNPLEKPMLIEDLVYKDKTGIAAILKKYNESLPYPIKVDDDGHWVASINISKKNYINKINDKKIKFTGNTVKSNTLPKYMQDFIEEGSMKLLSGLGRDFINYYYDTVSKLINRQIPIIDLLSKANMNSTVYDYIFRGNDKNGKLLAKQAHMELVLRDCFPIEVLNKIDELRNLSRTSQDFTHEMFKSKVYEITSQYNIPYNQGDTIYYINTAESKSKGDSSVDKDGNMSSTLVKDLDNIKNIQYNIPKYLSNFIERISSLFVVFKDEVAKELEKPFVQEKKNKKKIISMRKVQFANSDIKLLCKDFDTIDDLMTMETKEIKYWLKLDTNDDLKKRLSYVKPKDIFPHFKLPDYTKRSTPKIEKIKKNEYVAIVIATEAEIYGSQFYSDIKMYDILDVVSTNTNSELIKVINKQNIETHIPKNFVLIVKKEEANDVIFNLTNYEKIKNIDELIDFM